MPASSGQACGRRPVLRAGRLPRALLLPAAAACTAGPRAPSLPCPRGSTFLFQSFVAVCSAFSFSPSLSVLLPSSSLPPTCPILKDYGEKTGKRARVESPTPLSPREPADPTPSQR